MLHFDVIVLVLGQLPSPSLDFDRASGAGGARFRTTRKDKYFSYHFVYSYLPRATCFVAIPSAAPKHPRGKGNSAKDLVGCVHTGPHARSRFGSTIGCQ